MDLDGVEAQLLQVQNSVEGLREDIKAQLGICRELSLTRITTIQQSTDKAHLRLDKQKEAINDLCNWKNRIIGSMKTTAWVMSPILAIISSVITAIIILSLK